MIIKNRRKAAKPAPLRWAAAAALCLPVFAACASATTHAASNAAGSTATATPVAGPLLLSRCTQEQLAAAGGAVRVLNVISGQTVHVTVNERVDIALNWANMQPTSHQVQVRAGQADVCQRADVQSGGRDQRLPLVITGAGHAEFTVDAGFTAPGSVTHGLIYIDATADA